MQERPTVHGYYRPANRREWLLLLAGPTEFAVWMALLRLPGCPGDGHFYVGPQNPNELEGR